MTNFRKKIIKISIKLQRTLKINTSYKGSYKTKFSTELHWNKILDFSSINICVYCFQMKIMQYKICELNTGGNELLSAPTDLSQIIRQKQGVRCFKKNCYHFKSFVIAVIFVGTQDQMFCTLALIVRKDVIEYRISFGHDRPNDRCDRWPVRSGFDQFRTIPQ